MSIGNRMPQIITTGVEYENFLCRQIRKAGYHCDTTPVTGDQGVDLIVEVGSNKVAVQCKFYSTPVGNDAVQQVAAGKRFYNCNIACVVSNMTFTSSAIALAKALKVALIHHSKLLDWLQLNVAGRAKENPLGRTREEIKRNTKTLKALIKEARSAWSSREELGVFYSRLHPPMLNKARKCFEKVFEKDPLGKVISKRTILTLARMYRDGLGGKADINKAFSVCRAAGIKALDGVEVPPLTQ